MQLNSLAQSYKSTLDELKARKFFTPDFKQLNLYDNHILFLYDNYKHGFPGHEVTDRLEFLGEATTLQDNLVMRKLANAPVLFEVLGVKERNLHWATKVIGHAFIVSPYDLVQFDALMDNGGTHERRARWCYLESQPSPFKTGEKANVPCWMYFASTFYRSQVLTGTIAACQVKRDNKNYWDWRKSDLS